MKLVSIPMFCLLLFICSTGASQQAEVNSSQDSIADIPVGVTSFGGAVIGSKMYFYGGHTGDAHSYYESGQNKKLFVIDLSQPRKWKAVGEGIGLQGLAMVAYDGKLFRLGGFHAHNKKGEKHDLKSVSEFAVFDFKSKKWNLLEPMPEPRSSFDAVVVDGTIYVVGGWSMNGTQGTTWCETAYSIDLTTKGAKWKSLPNPPFVRRALSLGYQDGKVIAVGGMQQKGGPTTKTGLFDIKSQKWSDGPALEGKERMEGFGSSCFNIGGRLVVSTYGGNVYRLSKDFGSWEPVTKLEDGRFFHRLLPVDQSRFALIGGASMESGKFLDVELLDLKSKKPAKR